MKTKKKYLSPEIEKIELDNEIALQLESTPPVGPDESNLQAPDFFKNDPFQTNLV
jgi:hypothetical protein